MQNEKPTAYFRLKLNFEVALELFIFKRYIIKQK